MLGAFATFPSSNWSEASSEVSAARDYLSRPPSGLWTYFKLGPTLVSKSFRSDRLHGNSCGVAD